jgi:hypothetical protein
MMRDGIQFHVKWLFISLAMFNIQFLIPELSFEHFTINWNSVKECVTQKMEAAGSYEKSVLSHPTTWCHMPDDSSIRFNSIQFISVRFRSGLWPTGYRTCQFHLTLSVYITIHTKYKQPKIKTTIQPL